MMGNSFREVYQMFQEQINMNHLVGIIPGPCVRSAWIYTKEIIGGCATPCYSVEIRGFQYWFLKLVLLGNSVVSYCRASSKTSSLTFHVLEVQETALVPARCHGTRHRR